MERLCRGIRIDTEEWIQSNSCVYGPSLTKASIIVIKNGSWTPVEVKPETICVSTGASDINGTLAFENDFIKHDYGNEIGLIRYGEYRNPFNDDKFAAHIGFYVDWMSGDDKDVLRKDLGYWLKLTAIAGNIIETPDVFPDGCTHIVRRPPASANFTSYEELPLFLTVKDLMNLLHMERKQALVLMKSDSFPSILIGKKRLVSKENFMQWIKSR